MGETGQPAWAPSVRIINGLISNHDYTVVWDELGKKSNMIARIGYALVASIKVATLTSTTIYDEVREGLVRLCDRSAAQQWERVHLR